MNYQSEVLRVQTRENYGSRMPLDLCGDVMRRIAPLMSCSVRMALEGSSVSRGARPAWLEAASDIRFVDYASENGDTLLYLEAPRLGDAAPEIFEQIALCPSAPMADGTAVEVFATVVEEVREANPESLLFDRALLAKFKPLEGLFQRELRSLCVPKHANGAAATVTVDETVVRNAAQLSERTPPPQEVRVLGVLDMMRHSTRSFSLKLADGSEVRGVLEAQEQMESVKHLLGKKVLVLGKAVYRPSDAVLRIDARGVEPGEGHSELWSKIPPPRTRKFVPVRYKPGERQPSGVASFFGTWPGDETEEELLAMLRELRG